MKINLGFKPAYWDGPVSSEKGSKKSEKPPTCYPQMSIQGTAADNMLEKADTDDIVTATVRMRVVGTASRAARNSEYGGAQSPDSATMDFEVLSMDNVEIEGDDDDKKEETAEDAVDNYRKEKKGE